MDSFTRSVGRAAALTAAVDGLFSSILNRFFYGSTVGRLWQGVAAVPLGAWGSRSGWQGVAAGLAFHVAVAFVWSAVFLLALTRSPSLRRTLASSFGIVMIAALYGPLVWLVMSFGVIPAFTHRIAPITARWWVQFFGHIPFVGLPIVWSLAGRR